MMKMRKALFYILCMVTVIGGAVSCSLETDGSDDVGGYWHLESVDTLATGGVCNMASRRVFWAMQGKLLEVSDKDSGGACLMRFNHTADSLVLSEPRVNDRATGDPDVTDASVLAPYGIRHLKETFVIESLSGGKMVLSSGELRLGFKKF